MRHPSTGISIGTRGDTLLVVLLIVTLLGLMEVPLFNLLYNEMAARKTQNASEQAMQIAEAGINYYQWHLAHYPSDFQDGTGAPGPYTHNYVDYDTQTQIGQYQLAITPPSLGSTIVTIQSTGWTTTNPNVKRTITTRYGIPSLAIDSFLTNSYIWIGSDESVSGQMHANNMIRFDGTTNAPVMSAIVSGTCPSNLGSPCPHTESGVWGSASAAMQTFWSYPVPAIDFSTLTSNLATIKSTAQNGGIYLSPSTSKGYSLVFNGNGTVSIYKVTSLKSNPTPEYDVNKTQHNEYVDYQNRTLLSTQSLPANGTIYIEDNVWVEGVVKGRVMVAAALLPYNSSNAPTIYIPNNIVYAAKDGTSVLGLLAQNNIVVTYHAPTDLEIDAAMVAQNGSVQFLEYNGNVKNSISVYGSIMTYGQWTWSYVNGNNTVSGYQTTNDVYDGNLLYGPPPNFPLSSNGYQQLSWSSN